MSFHDTQSVGGGSKYSIFLSAAPYSRGIKTSEKRNGFEEHFYLETRMTCLIRKTTRNRRNVSSIKFIFQARVFWLAYTYNAHVGKRCERRYREISIPIMAGIIIHNMHYNNVVRNLPAQPVLRSLGNEEVIRFTETLSRRKKSYAFSNYFCLSLSLFISLLFARRPMYVHSDHAAVHHRTEHLME